MKCGGDKSEKRLELASGLGSFGGKGAEGDILKFTQKTRVIYLFKNMYLLIYLAMPGLSCGTWIFDSWQHMNSQVAGRKQFPDQD